jgi:micrococcal nuclease
MRKRILGGAFITGAAALALQLPHVMNNPEVVTVQVPVTLVDTVDGDMFKIRMNGKVETVRYLLVDTPESKKPGICVQPYAKEAYIRNAELVKVGRLTLEFDKGETRDSYGRLLAYVYVDGASVQEKLL